MVPLPFSTARRFPGKFPEFAIFHGSQISRGISRNLGQGLAMSEVTDTGIPAADAHDKPVLSKPLHASSSLTPRHLAALQQCHLPLAHGGLDIPSAAALSHAALLVALHDYCSVTTNSYASVFTARSLPPLHGVGHLSPRRLTDGGEKSVCAAGTGGGE